MEQNHWIYIAIVAIAVIVVITIYFNQQSFLNSVSAIYANIESIIAIVLSASLTAYFTYALTEKGRRNLE